MSRKNDPVEKFIASVFKSMGFMLKSMLHGFKKLKNKSAFMGFTVCVFLAFVSILFKTYIYKLSAPDYMPHFIFWSCFTSPLIFLFILGRIGSGKQKKYDTIFKDIGFVGRDKRYPYLINIREDGKKTIYLFKSNIPLAEWKKAKDKLETGLDCSIRQINNEKNKKMVELVCVSSDYKIPEMLRWNDGNIIDRDGVISLGESDLSTITFDLNRTPHVLAAGETGSGKSVVLRTILWQMINKGCCLFMIDFKGGVEFGKVYEKYGEVITDRHRALEVFHMLTAENAERLKLFRELEVKNLKEYNEKTNSNLCRIGVFIDEIAEMLDKKGVSKEDKVIFEQLEGALSTLARLSRATGINLFLGVQRPDANVLTGQIKNNVPVRISGRFADKSASEIVLGNTAACELPDIKGRFIYKVGNESIPFQAYYFDDDTMLHEVDSKQGDMLVNHESIPDKKVLPAKGITKAPATVNQDKFDLNFDFNFE